VEITGRNGLYGEMGEETEAVDSSAIKTVLGTVDRGHQHPGV
jgi:hypothetical protein